MTQRVQSDQEYEDIPRIRIMIQMTWMVIKPVSHSWISGFLTDTIEKNKSEKSWYPDHEYPRVKSYFVLLSVENSFAITIILER